MNPPLNWSSLARFGPIVACAPMDGYTDSAYRQVIKHIAPETVVFSEFYSADGLVRSPDLANRVLRHDTIESPVVFQIFGNNPEMFAKAAKIIEEFGGSGVDVNMGCPAKKVVKSGYGSGLMIHEDIAYRCIEAMIKATSLPVSVKTRLGWDSWEHLIPFCQGLERAGASLISVHGRTYQQKFSGKADWTGIYELKRNLSIPVIGNGDVRDHADGMSKLGNLDGYMIARASVGNPWCFRPDGYRPTMREVLDTMHLHATKIVALKGEMRGPLEIRKHLVGYLRDLPNIHSYRKRIVEIASLSSFHDILTEMKLEYANLLETRIGSYISSETPPEDTEWCG